MNIITNNNLPKETLKRLESFGEIILLQSKGIVYDAISAHPDIFCCVLDGELIIAPNLPDNYKNIFHQKNITCLEGYKDLGNKYPETAFYNAVFTENYLIANTKVVDESILNSAKSRKIIHVNQAYTRCNLLPLPGENFITSDMGIYNQLQSNGLSCLFVNPDSIVLKGFKNGFFGGCCGVYENKVFIAGNLNHFPEGEKIKGFLEDLEIIELYDGPLLDVGSLFFVD